MEQEIESRIIAQDDQNNWHVAHGPFEGFDQLGEQGWTLLVQAVNNWSEATNKLIEPFNFVPQWRLDDVMVSFSTPNAGVGPHVDQYDVFIIQGSGSRRWQVGQADSNLRELLPHPELKQVAMFEPILDEITQAGDILYIPPNFPHNGVALENAMNFSIGFQAPSSQDLFSAFTDALIDNEIGEERFPDHQRKLTNSPEMLTTSDVLALKAFMLAQAQDDQLFAHMIASHLTASHHTLEILVPVEPFTAESVYQYLTTPNVTIRPVLGIKSLICESSGHLYINGDRFLVLPESKALAQNLAKKQLMTTESVKSFLDSLKNTQLLTNVLNTGFWYID